MMKRTNGVFISLMALMVLVGCGGEMSPPPPAGQPAPVPPGGHSVRRVPAPDPQIEDVRCSYSESAAPLSGEQLGQAGSYAVGTESVTFIDTSRKTPPSGSFKGSDQRKLDTSIYFPAEPKPLWQLGPAQVAQGKPFPLVMYSHGYSSSKDEVKSLATHLASHGFIVVAPSFPLTNMFSPGGPNFIDVVNQPGDISFVIDQMLTRSKAATDRFFGAIDAARIAAVGLSLGGLTTSLVTYHLDLGDKRIKAAATLAGPSSFFTEKFYSHHVVPLLMLHGEIDAFISYKGNARPTLQRAQPNVNLVTLRAGSHTAFADMPEVLLKLLATVVAPEGAHPDNPDALGCGLMAGILADNANQDGSNFFADLLDPEAGIAMPAEGEEGAELPCQNGLIQQPALAAPRQHEITRRAVLAFLQAYLAPSSATRESSCRFLHEGLETDPDVHVE
jgi:dienelactone hydrolase